MTYGYLFLHVLLCREGWPLVNHKRVHRLYQDEGLTQQRLPPDAASQCGNACRQRAPRRGERALGHGPHPRPTSRWHRVPRAQLRRSVHETMRRARTRDPAVRRPRGSDAEPTSVGTPPSFNATTASSSHRSRSTTGATESRYLWVSVALASRPTLPPSRASTTASEVSASPSITKSRSPTPNGPSSSTGASTTTIGPTAA